MIFMKKAYILWGIFFAGLVALAGPSSNRYIVGQFLKNGTSVLTIPLNIGADTVTTIAASQTLTNKSMSGGSNTFTNVPASSALTGQVPVANGGTGLASGTSSGIPYFSGSTTLASSNALTSHGVIVSESTSSPVTVVGGAGTLFQGNGSGSDPTATATPTLGVASTTTGTLALASSGGGSVTLSAGTGSITSYTVVMPTAICPSGQVMASSGSSLTAWTCEATAANPMTTSQDIIVGGASGAQNRLGIGANGTVLGTGSGTLAYASLPGNTTYLTIPQVMLFQNAGNNNGTGTTGTISTSSACITSVGSLAEINVGAGITDGTTSTNITNGTYVVGIPGTCSAGQIQMSANAAGNGSGDTLIFGANHTTTGTISTSSVCITSPGSTAGIAPYSFIIDNTHSALTFGTYVVAIPGTCSSGQIQMNQVATTNETGDSLTFSGGPMVVPTPTPLYAECILVHGGAGGGSSGTGSTNAGSNGSPSYIANTSVTWDVGGTSAGGGGAGASAGGLGGTPGSVVYSGEGLTLQKLWSASGAYGGSGIGAISSAPLYSAPGSGGGTCISGGPGGANAGSANAPAANSGGGGAGGGIGGTSSSYSGGGGGSGGCTKFILSGLSAGTDILVRPGGTASGGSAGSSGNAGAGGAAGIISCTWYWQ